MTAREWLALVLGILIGIVDGYLVYIYWQTYQIHRRRPHHELTDRDRVQMTRERQQMLIDTEQRQRERQP